jgi:predicted RNA polymerase sigma factor
MIFAGSWVAVDQDRAQWDPVHVMRGLAALDRAEALATELGLCTPGGDYALQAAIAACHHARAETAEATDWWALLTCTSSWHESLARRWWR